MLLKHPQVQFKTSTELKRYSSVHSLTSQLQKVNDQTQNKQPSSLKRRNSQFIPFCQQRNLGKLISNKNNTLQLRKKQKNVEDLLDIVNFRNFKKLYNMEKKIQQAKYTIKIRNSGQINLIKENQWEIKDLSKKSSLSSSPKLLPQQSHRIQKSQQIFNNLRNCCYQKGLPKVQQSLEKSNQSFNKIDTQLYKKIAVNRPPSGNIELQNLFKHYVQACELNQNQRRRFLTQRAK